MSISSREELFNIIVSGDGNKLNAFDGSHISIDTPIDDNGTTILMYAAGEGDTKIIEKLILLGANVNSADNDDEPPLMWASSQGRLEAVKQLLAGHAAVDQVSGTGGTALRWAVQYNHKDVVELLCASGANVNSANNWGQTPLIVSAQNNHIEIFRTLIHYRAELEHEDCEGRNAEAWARTQNSHSILKCIKLIKST